MLDKKLQRVRDITSSISEFIGVVNILGCNELLERRLVLLKEIEQEILQSDNKDSLDEFKALLLWVVERDKASQENTLKLKSRYQEELSKQKKNKFAIASYKNICN